MQLFLRNSRGVQLTKAGEFFLTHARELLEKANQTIALAKQAAHGDIGTLRIGYSASAIFSKPLTSAIAKLVAERPMLEVQLVEGTALSHIAALKRGRLDAAVMRTDLDNLPLMGLKVTRLADEPLFAVLPPKHALASRALIELRELAGERLLLQPASQRTFLRRQVESLADRAGLLLERSIDVPNIGSTLCFVEAGIGVAILPASATSMAHGLVAVPLSDPGSSQPLSLAYNADNPFGDRLELALSRQ